VLIDRSHCHLAIECDRSARRKGEDAEESGSGVWKRRGGSVRRVVVGKGRCMGRGVEVGRSGVNWELGTLDGRAGEEREVGRGCVGGEREIGRERKENGEGVEGNGVEQHEDGSESGRGEEWRKVEC